MELISDKNHVRQISGFLSPDVCQRAIEQFNASEDDVYAGGTISGINPVRRCEEIWINKTKHLKDWKWLIQEFYHGLFGAKEIIDQLDAKPNTTLIPDSIKMLRYQTGFGQGYDWHIDGGCGLVALRQMSVIAYVNDVSEGGETEFVDGQKFKPQQGTALFFPSGWTHKHQALEPVSETKFVINCFLTVPPCDWPRPDVEQMEWLKLAPEYGVQL